MTWRRQCSGAPTFAWHCQSFWYCVLVVASLCGTVLIAGLLMSRPVQFVVGRPPPGLVNAEAVQIPSGSGTVLSGWWIGGKPGGGCVVLMHGVRRNRPQHGTSGREILHQLGFAVLLFDFQAHGTSPGRAITFWSSRGIRRARRGQLRPPAASG